MYVYVHVHVHIYAGVHENVCLCCKDAMCYMIYVLWCAKLYVMCHRLCLVYHILQIDISLCMLLVSFMYLYVYVYVHVYVFVYVYVHYVYLYMYVYVYMYTWDIMVLTAGPGSSLELRAASDFDFQALRPAQTWAKTTWPWPMNIRKKSLRPTGSGLLFVGPYTYMYI